MNKIRKFKQTFTEDSSDYVSSDIEACSSVFSKAPKSIDADDYSNDSFADNESTSTGEKRFKKAIFSNFASQQQQQQNKDSRLSECLNYLHSLIGRKDKEGIFQDPVTDLIAPGYSLIIKDPMDLSTMKTKIDSNEYRNVMEYRDDLILMCENCMTYNKPDTIYYHAARKMLDYGFKLLSRDKLLSLRHTVRIMRMLTSDELGFSLHVTEPADAYLDLNSINRHKQQQSDALGQLSKSSPASKLSNKIAKSKILQKLDALQQSYPKVQDSYLIPPEGEDNNDEDEDITEEVLEVARKAKEKLEAKNKNGKIGFLRRNSNGTTGYHFLKSEDDDDTEKTVTIGNLCEGLQQSNYSMSNFTEDKKNKTKPMYYLENGPFSSHAPVNDNSYSNFSKEETDILMNCYGDEIGYQYALSLMDFAKGTNPVFYNYTQQLLNEISVNEHEKYMKYIKNKKETVGDIESNVTKT